MANNVVTEFRGYRAMFGQFPVKPLFHGKLRKKWFSAIFPVSRVIGRGQKPSNGVPRRKATLKSSHNDFMHIYHFASNRSADVIGVV